MNNPTYVTSNLDDATQLLPDLLENNTLYPADPTTSSSNRLIISTYTLSRELGLLLFSLTRSGKYVDIKPIIPLCFEALCSLRWLAAIERIATAITTLIENTEDGSTLADKILAESFTSI